MWDATDWGVARMVQGLAIFQVNTIALLLSKPVSGAQAEGRYYEK